MAVGLAYGKPRYGGSATYGGSAKVWPTSSSVSAQTGWVFYLVEPFTGKVRAEVPFTSFEYTDDLNNAGGWSASIPINHAKATNQNLFPVGTLVYASKNDTFLYGGILWTADGQSEGDVRIGGQGIWSLFKDERRRIVSRNAMTYATGYSNDEITWTGVDQMRIVVDIMNHVLSQSAVIPIEGLTMQGPVSGGLSGITRDLTLWTYESPSVGRVIESIGNLQTGIDFSFSYSWGAESTVSKTFNVWYPRKGGRGGVVFEHGKNIKVLRRMVDGTKFATQVITTGAGSGDNLMSGSAVDNSIAWPAGVYPHINTFEQYPSIDSQDLLDQLAQRGLAQVNQPLEYLEAQVIDTTDSELGTFSTGDSVYVSAHEGWIDVEGWYRIESIRVQVGGDGEEVINVAMSDEQHSLGWVL